jgi:hypothetical protein
VVGVLVVVADVGTRDDGGARGVETDASSELDVELEVRMLMGAAMEVSSLVAAGLEAAGLDVSLGIRTTVLVDVVPGKSVKIVEVSTPPSPTHFLPISQQPYCPLSPRVQ